MPGSFDPSFDSSFETDSTAQAGPELSVFEEICALLLKPAQDLENTMIAVRDESVNDAVGVRLDPLGNIVGLKRDFSPLFTPSGDATADDNYRRAIRAWFRSTRSTGKREELLAVARLVLNDPAATIAIRRDGTATLLIQIVGVPVSAGTEAVLVLMLTRAASDGIRVVIESFAGAPSTTFLFGTGVFDNSVSPGTGSLFADGRSIDN